MLLANHTNRCIVGLLVTFAASFGARTGVAQCEFEYVAVPATVLGADLQGQAAVITAWGNYDVNEGQAAILGEQARTLRSDNNLKQTAALLQQLKMLDDARYQARKDRDARLAEGRKRLAEQRTTIYREAYRLPPGALDLSSGAISWPAALRAERFQSNRTQLEELFRQHAGYGSPRANKVQEISQSVDNWAHDLRKQIGSMSREDYVVAQKFLMGLKYGAASPIEST